jgi:Fic-DOC domain mobile mystery protein B
MFNKTWKWAGRYRLTEKNIGVPFYQIQERLKALLDDAQYWLDNKTYSLDELAIRFHHRLVSIHPFPNGNGRHARLMTDLIVVKEKSPRFNWGNKNIVSAGAARVNYINALKKADDGDIRPLIEFAR